MKYLLDVNALIALKHRRSTHHQACRLWASKKHFASLASCALTELGFIQVSMFAFGLSLTEAQQDLADLKTKIVHFVESCPSPKLPNWSSSSAKTTDAYLLQIAKSTGMELATFDTGIPGATLIT